MKDKDYIKELFSEKLSSHEVPVRSDLWSGIQSQLGNTATTAAAAKGISVAAKWAIGIASSVVVAGSVAWFASGDAEQPKVKEQLAKTEESAPVSKQDEDGIESAIGYSQPQVVENDQDQPAGTVTKRNNELPVTQAAGTQAPLIVKQRQDEVPNAGTPANVSDRSNQGTAVAGVTAQNAGSTSSSNTGQTQNTNKNVVGYVQEWVNVFSPNGDNANDVFKLKTENLKDFSITVIDEKNQAVFTSDDPGFEWNGINAKTGEFVPDGNYGYVVIATDVNGNLVKRFKNLTIKK